MSILVVSAIIMVTSGLARVAVLFVLEYVPLSVMFV